MVPLDNESLEFEDGSFTADIPRKRLSELFHVTQDIVSQVNPHVVPLLSKLGDSKHHGAFNWLRHAELALLPTMLEGMRALSSMQLLPAMFGSSNASKSTTLELNQKYSGAQQSPPSARIKRRPRL